MQMISSATSEKATTSARLMAGGMGARALPARLENFRIEIDAPVELDEKHRAGIEAAVHHCLIHNTLLHPPQIEIAIDHAVLIPH